MTDKKYPTMSEVNVCQKTFGGHTIYPLTAEIIDRADEREYREDLEDLRQAGMLPELRRLMYAMTGEIPEEMKD